MSLLTRIIHGVESAVERIVKGPMTQEAVEKALDQFEETGPERLAWRTSLVDLLQILDLPYSMADRADLARELGFDYYTGSVVDNNHLRELVIEKIAARYIKIPKTGSTSRET